MRNLNLATLAGLLTWLMVYAISLYIMRDAVSVRSLLSVHALFIAYGSLFWVLAKEQSQYALESKYGGLLLVAQLAVAFSLLWLFPSRYFDFLSILTIIWAAMLPFVMRTSMAMLVVLLVVAAWYAVVAWQTETSVWISALLYGSFHLFAVLVQSASRDANLAKAELEQKHQQLLATQQLLQGASRQSERTRIARNLHDVVGHHLTALTIQLQVASHLSDGEAKKHVDKCHQLAKLLLSDVREAVSTMREYTDVPLLDAVTSLTTLLPEQLKVELSIPRNIMLHDLQQAQHLLCIIQEAISNSLKHSGASQVVIKANVEHGRLQMVIHDNGTVAPQWRRGNGLKGMQERMAECSGSLQFDTTQQAMQLTITLPYTESDHA